MNPIKTYIAKHKLEKHRARQKALRADYTARRNAQLSSQRKAHIKRLMNGYVRDRSYD